MDDRLDEELKNRIKKVFDEYQDPSADEGWAELRKKFPEQADKRRGLIWLWLGAAAVVLIALSIGIWKFSGENSSQQNVAVVKNHPAMPEKATTPAAKPAETQPQLAATGGHSATAAGPEKQPAPHKNAITKKTQAPAPVNNIAAANVSSHAGDAGKSVPQVLASNTATTSKNTLPVKHDSAQVAANIAPANKPSINNNGNQGASQATTQQPANNKPKSVTDMLAQNNPETKKVDIKPSRVRLGVYAASFVNYAKGSGNQGNVGAGFTAEIQIVKHLKLVTGVTLAQNSLNYTGGVPTGAVQTGFFSAAEFPGYASMGTLAVVKPASAEEVASVPAFQNYGVSMFNIDVPVNLKFDFNIKRNNFYLMTGLSSGTFASQSYTYYYNYPDLPSAALQQPHAETSKTYFNNFYVGKMLNLAVGYGYPIGRNHIIIEPFVKYPLGGLGAQDIRFGSGGINLKLNFPTK